MGSKVGLTLDRATSAASFLGFCLAGIGSGENHLFGHGRYEWLMGFLSALAVLVMGGTLAKSSITTIHTPKNIEFNWIILLILICSILVKLYMFFYNRNIACKINSSAVKGINSLIIHDYGLGHYVASMHIEGEEENSVILSDIANKVSYVLYLEMDCDTTIQIDYLDPDPVLYDLIYKKAEQEIQKFEANGKIKSLRIVKSGMHKNVLFIVSGSRNLQKKQDQVREVINQSILSVNSNCRVITKIVIAALNPKK